MPLTWILRVRSAQPHSAAVVEALGGPGVLLPALLRALAAAGASLELCVMV